MLDRSPDDDLLILASDGLWDVLTNQEATAIARAALEVAESRGGAARASRVGAVRKAASALTRAALERGSRDNVTSLCINLRGA